MALQAEAPARTEDASTMTSAALESFLGYNLKRAFNAIHANLALTLQEFDLRMVTYAALAVILENGGLRQTELAAALRIDRGNAVAIVDELERRGLVTRDKHPDDRRSHALNITPAGRTLCDRAIKADRACEARILSDLGADRAQQVFDDLRAMEKAANRVLDQRRDLA